MNKDLQRSYDDVADEYARHFADELDHKPFDRKMLDWLAEKAGPSEIIGDMGCGPGHIARYLHERGAKVCGLDLSAGMVECARRLNPEIRFQQGDMLDLAEVADNSYGGIAAFYSIVHIPRSNLGKAFQELNRVLAPSGTLLLTFHIGRETVHRDELFGAQVSMDFIFFETEEMKGFLTAAEFQLQEVIERDPYPEVEYPSRRGYIFARKLSD